MATLTTLAHTQDQAAWNVHWAFLKRYGADSGQFLPVESLIEAPLWSHRQGGAQMLRVETQIRLASDETLSSTSDTLFFNRLRQVTVPVFTHSSWQDRTFATLEWHALLLSWLESLPCRVINPARPHGLSGGIYSDAQWAFLGKQAELPVLEWSLFTNARHAARRDKTAFHRPQVVNGRVCFLTPQPLALDETHAAERKAGCYREEIGKGTVRTVLVTGNTVTGEIPKRLEIGCIKLARIVGCELLQLWFVAGKRVGDWRLTCASTWPALATQEDLEAVVHYLGEQTGQE